MALLSSFQLHSTITLFDSLHSLSKLQPPRFHLFLNSTFPSKPLHSPIKSTQFDNPCRKSSKSSSHRRHLSSWIQNWSKPNFPALPKMPQAVVDYRNGLSSDDDEVGTSRSAGSSTMKKIVEKLKKFGYIDDSGERKERPLPEKGSVEDIFYAEDGVLPDSRGGLSLDLQGEVRFPWEKPAVDKEREESARRKRSRTSLAELTIPEGELRRLRHMAIRMKSKTKIGGAGVTKEIVDLIHEKWKTEEVVRLKCEGPPALNMKRMHEILEVEIL